MLASAAAVPTRPSVARAQNKSRERIGALGYARLHGEARRGREGWALAFIIHMGARAEVRGRLLLLHPRPVRRPCQTWGSSSSSKPGASLLSADRAQGKQAIRRHGGGRMDGLVATSDGTRRVATQPMRRAMGTPPLGGAARAAHMKLSGSEDGSQEQTSQVKSS